MWHDKNIQSNAPYRQVLTTQLNHLKRPVWLNGWVFVYELSGCGFESSCSQFLALELLSLIQQIYDCGVVVNDVVAVTTAQHHSTKPQQNLILHRFKSFLHHVGYLWCWKSIKMVPAGNKATRYSLVKHSAKTICDHHHYHHHQR